jgi:hypothetical protein
MMSWFRRQEKSPHEKIQEKYAKLRREAYRGAVTGEDLAKVLNNIDRDEKFELGNLHQNGWGADEW